MYVILPTHSTSIMPFDASRSFTTQLHVPSHRSNRLQGAYYKSFSYPVLKCFLGALFTYQLAYYAWMKLEVIEEQHDAATRIAGLKTDLRDAVVEQRAKAREAVATTAAAATTGEEGKGGVGQDKDEGGKKKKGWLGW